jgi:hypothetical protein
MALTTSKSPASAQQSILQSAHKPLRWNAPTLGSFTVKSLYRLIRNLTLNQRIPAQPRTQPLCARQERSFAANILRFNHTTKRRQASPSLRCN